MALLAGWQCLRPALYISMSAEENYGLVSDWSSGHSATPTLPLRRSSLALALSDEALSPSKMQKLGWNGRSKGLHQIHRLSLTHFTL